MASPKIPKLMMHSTPGRHVRSPGLHRRTKLTDEDAVAAKLSKKSRRSRSSDQCTSRDPDTPGPVRKDVSKDEQSEDSSSHATVSHTLHRSAEERWKIMLKSIEKMSREEIMSNFRLLMSDHLKLEKFLSFITRENDATRNRLESDLLDAMMNIEELKQALEVRVARRSRVDPREAEERRSLIRQNKKLLRQLYESAKKIDKLEVTIREGQEQLELMEFQMLESENLTKSGSCSSEPPSEEKLKYLEELVDKLRQENQELREQSILLDDPENAPDENTKLNQMKILIQEKDQIQRDLKAQLQVYAERCQRLEAALRSQQACPPQTSRGEPAVSYNHHTSGAASNSYDSAFFESSGNNFSFIESGFEDSEAESDFSKQLTPTRPRSPDRTIDRSSYRNMAAEPQTANSDQPKDEEQDDMENVPSAMNSLFTRSLFPLSAMVPLENQEIVREIVPDYMKPKEEDGLIQSTVRHFQSLVNDKEREIDELKSKIASLEEQIKEISSVSTSAADDPSQQELHQAVAALDVQVKQMKAENETLRERGAASEKALQEQCDTLLKENEALVIELKDRDAKIASFDGEKEKCKEEIEKTPAEKKIENLLNKVDRLERENERWRALVERMNRNDKDSAPDLMAAKEALKQSQARESSLRGQLDSTLQEMQALQAKIGGVEDNDERNPRYFSLQLQEVRHEHQVEELQTKLAYSERRKQEVERTNAELVEELTEKKRSNESLEVALLAAKKMEATLKRRVEALELKKSGASGDNYAKVAQLEAKVAQLESINSSLSESCKMERSRLHEQTVRIRQLEADQRNMTDRLQDLQSREMCGQKKILRLQAIYEDMLREYAEVKTHDISWRKRAKGYESLEEDLKHKLEEYEKSMKVLHREKVTLDSQVCQAREEVKSLKESLQAMQKKAEQREQTYQETIELVDTYQLKLTQTNQKLNEAQAKLHELEKVAASKNLTPQRGNGNERRPSNPNTPETPRRGQNSRNVDTQFYEQRLNESQENERKLKTKMRQLEESEQKLQTKILQLEAKIATLNRKGEVSESVNAIQDALVQRERDLAEARREIKNLKDEVDEAKALYENRTAEVMRLRTKVNSLENQMNDQQSSNSFYPPPGYSLVKDRDQV